MTPANDNTDNGWKKSTTYRYLQNLKKMPYEQAHAIWTFQNKQKGAV